MTHAKTRQNSPSIEFWKHLTGRYSVIQVAPSTLLTVQWRKGQRAIVPVDVASIPEASHVVKSLRQATVASSINSKRSTSMVRDGPLDTAKKDKGKRRDWLRSRPTYSSSSEQIVRAKLTTLCSRGA